MSRKYFGTDGVRGRVGQSPITPDFVMRLGYSAGKALLEQSNMPPGERPAVLIGKDTRLSGYMLESALEAGLLRDSIGGFWGGADDVEIFPDLRIKGASNIWRPSRWLCSRAPGGARNRLARASPEKAEFPCCRGRWRICRGV